MHVYCRDRDGKGRLGGEALPVAEPCVQGPLLQQRQLRRRVQDREVPQRRVQDAWRHAKVLLQGGLLVHAAHLCLRAAGGTASRFHRP